jgi:hypothetical protein
MAHLYPPTASPQTQRNHAEWLLFEALRTRLSDDWYVYHHLTYVDADTASEGEADFVVVHPRHGMLVIECKGRGVAWTAQSGWHRLERDGRRTALRENPAEQAQRTVKELVAGLTARLPHAMPEWTHLPLIHGHAVALPEVRAGDTTLPLDWPRPLVFDADDLARLAQRIPEALAFWAQNRAHLPPPLAPEVFRRFRKQVLQPELRLVPTLGAEIEGEAEVLWRLTREQAAVMEGFADWPQLVVTGGAGTGKTVLAVHLAREAAQQGAQVLLVCFTKALGRHLQAKANRGPPTPGRITATSFHRLCRQAHDALAQAFDVPAADLEQQFWREDAALVLLEAIDQGKLGPWDTLIVDEAQDFPPLWIRALQHGLRRDGSTRQVFFADPKQQLFDAGGALPAGQPYKLQRNLRNTRRIAEMVALLGDGAPRPSEHAPEGESPEVQALPPPTELALKLEALVCRLLNDGDLTPRQVTLLTPHRRQNSSLAGLTALAGVPLVDRPEDREEGLLHTTISAFKGLESDVVVLLDVRSNDPRCLRAARYVAASRAQHRLFVFADGDWLHME